MSGYDFDPPLPDEIFQDPNTPEGFRFLMNLSRTYFNPETFSTQTAEEVIAEMRKKFGDDNVVVTEPAYDVYGKPWPWSGVAVHVRKDA